MLKTEIFLLLSPRVPQLAPAKISISVFPEHTGIQTPREMVLRGQTPSGWVGQEGRGAAAEELYLSDPGVRLRSLQKGAE